MGTGNSFDRKMISFDDASIVVCFGDLERGFHKRCDFLPMVIFILAFDTRQYFFFFLDKLAFLT